MGSIRYILEDFVTRTKQMYNYTELNDHGEPLDKFEKEFQKLRETTLKYRTEKTFATVHGENEFNIKKNRYKDILPYDYTRVVLSEIPNEPQSDYINANWVKGAMGQSVYIASQGPMPATVNDFWRMLWQYDISIVVMVCNEYEGRKLKCQKYWAEGDESLKFGNIRVSLHDSVSPSFKKKEREETSLSDCRVRHLKAEFNNKSRHLIQFHYTAWPDHGIPEQVSPILDMVAMMREYQPADDRPIVIHCSAGCGRTGTVIAIDHCWNLLKMGMLKPNFKLYDVIYDMRQQRPSIVQTKEQYMLVHKAVMELYQRHLEMIEEHIYSNVDAEHMYINTEPDYNKLAGLKTRVSTVYSVETEKVSKSSPAYLSVQRWVCQNGNLEPVNRQDRHSLQQRPDSTTKPPQASPRTSLSPGQQRKMPSSPRSQGPGQPATFSKPPITSPKPKLNTGTESKSPPGAPPSPTSIYAFAQPLAQNKTDTAQTGTRNSSQGRKGLMVQNRAYGMSNGGVTETLNYSRASYNGSMGAVQVEDNYNEPIDCKSSGAAYTEPYGTPSKPPLPNKSPAHREGVEEYSYADPLRADKWHLQKMAREMLESANPPSKRGPVQSITRSASLKASRPEAYETVEIENKGSYSEAEAEVAPQAYSQVQGKQTAEPCVPPRTSTDMDYDAVGWQRQESVSVGDSEYECVFQRPRSSDDDGAAPPPVPSKNLGSPNAAEKADKVSLHSMDGAIGDSKFAVLKKLKNKVFKPTDSSSKASAPAVTQGSNNIVYFKGHDISFGKRVGKPVGPRQSSQTASY